MEMIVMIISLFELHNDIKERKIIEICMFGNIIEI